MKGLVALAGSGESLPVLECVDGHLLGSVHANGGLPRPVCFPKSAGPFKPGVSLLRCGLNEGRFIIGIDENTALVGNTGDMWQVMGAGGVDLLSRDHGKSYKVGDLAPIPGEGGR